jgi:pyruvate dehydrogenase E2 component (dihydrolipoamide acetyltransferase)
MIEITLPALGADMDEGTLLEWRVHPGDQVHKGDILAVVDTTKAALDVESWHDGAVWELLLEPGQTVPVGTVMARLLEPGEVAPARAMSGAAVTPAAVPPATPPSGSAAPGERVAAAPAAPAARPAAAPGAPPARRPISPAARRRAAELGVALEPLAGTGPHGAVSVQDVERAAAPRSAARDRSSEIRATIARVMARSKREVPHYYLSDDIPLAAAMAWLRQVNEGRPITGRILIAALYIRAVARAAQQHPAMNGYFTDGVFHPSATVNLGMAISLRGGGLLAPAIFHAESKTVAEVMHALADLVARTRAGTLRREEVADPTLTVTNLGDQSVTSVQPIIYAPQVAIVGFGRVSDRPWVSGDKVGIVPVVTATLAADHRVSDGHGGARFLAAIAANLQHPETL